MSVLQYIRTALDRRLQAYQSDDVAWENVKYEPRVNVPWLKVKLLPARSLVVGIGQNAIRQHSGIYQVSVMVPPNSSIVGAVNKAEAVMAQFPYGLTMDESGIRIMMLLPYASPALNDGTWVSVPVSCPWNVYEKP